MPEDIKPVARRYERTRQAIVDAAYRIIAEGGVEALSMRSLAEASDYTAPALYKYFESKEDLLQALGEMGLERLRVHLRANVPAEATPPEKLFAAAMAYIDFARMNPELYLLMFNRPYARVAISDIQTDATFGDLLSLAAEGVRLGFFKSGDRNEPMVLAFHMWATLHGMAMLRLSMLLNAEVDFEALIRRSIRSYVDSLS